MAHLSARTAYKKLVQRINKFPQGAPPSELLYKILQMLFSENAFWAIFLAAFTPIPYKLFTISAGFFGIYFLTFIVASILGRASRFFIVAYLVKRFGKKIGDVVFKYFNLFSLLFGLYVVLVVLSLKFF